jgi:hypothetical protein
MLERSEKMPLPNEVMRFSCMYLQPDGLNALEVRKREASEEDG